MIGKDEVKWQRVGKNEEERGKRESVRKKGKRVEEKERKER